MQKALNAKALSVTNAAKQRCGTPGRGKRASRDERYVEPTEISIPAAVSTNVMPTATAPVNDACRLMLGGDAFPKLETR